MTSEQIHASHDPSSRQNGNNAAACINGEYERDYILEAML